MCCWSEHRPEAHCTDSSTGGSLGMAYGDLVETGSPTLPVTPVCHFHSSWPHCTCLGLVPSQSWSGVACAVHSSTCQLWALGLVPVGQLSNTPAVLVHWSPGAGPALSIYPLVVSAHHSDKSTGHLVALTYIFFFYSPHSLKEKYAFIFHEDYSKMYCSCSHEN